MNYENREKWLTAAAAEIEADLLKTRAGIHLPAGGFRVSCGFPSKKATGASPAGGQCWSPECSKSGHYEIFISPILSEPVEVLATLLHELIHASVGIECKHKGEFKEAAKACGLVGKMTHTEPGERLIESLQEIAEVLGEYPHASLQNMTTGVKKDTTRMLKIVCPECGYTLRAAKKWLEVGLPTCCCGEAFKEG